MNIDIIGKRYIFFIVSLAIILPGLILGVVMAVNGELPLAIDFTGGTLIEIKLSNGQEPQPADIVLLYKEIGIDDVKVQTTSQGTFVSRSSLLAEDVPGKIIEEMKKKFDADVTILRIESVGPTVGREVTQRAALAVGVAAFVVVLYITFAFRGIPNAFRYGICAIIAMFHDVLVVISITAIGSYLWGWQIDALFLTALLTVIGFSVQDKIVVFDRIRENSSIYRRLPYETLVNHSIVQTLQRSINTQLMTVEFMLLALALFGGVTLQPFSWTMLIGLFCGTYSSIFIAATLLVIWENHEWQNWFRRKESPATV
ncbi:MAG: protein translocase subunit SecF [Anaerolineales bacterium]|jgi:preprotein translocase subunit SecF